MSAPRFATRRVLGLFLVLMAYCGAQMRAEDTKPPEWSACKDEAVAAAFEKSRGQKPWKVQFGTLPYSHGDGKTISEEIAKAWVLGEPEKAGDRVQEGVVAYLRKSIPGKEPKGWFPGNPFEWRDVKGTADEKLFAERYVIVHPPSKLKIPSALAGRVYSQPIFVSAGISPEECVLLVDATYSALVESRDRKDSADLTGLFGRHGNPYFVNVAAIDTKDHARVMPGDIADRFRYVGIFGPNGETWVVFDIKEGKAVLVNVGSGKF